MKELIPTEDQEQTAVFDWVMVMQNIYPELGLLFHIPNGGSRHPAEAKKMRLMGVKPGVPDLFLPVPRGAYHGLWIEMKRRKGGRLSDEQAVWLDVLNGQGYKAIRCDGAEAACDALEEYLKTS